MLRGLFLLPASWAIRLPSSERMKSGLIRCVGPVSRLNRSSERDITPVFGAPSPQLPRYLPPRIPALRARVWRWFRPPTKPHNPRPAHKPPMAARLPTRRRSAQSVAVESHTAKAVCQQTDDRLFIEEPRHPNPPRLLIAADRGAGVLVEFAVHLARFQAQLV
jgi:hypothetical protein